ncbi:aminotransferase class IV [Aporhodopirellula aestuarii]|uniref:Aminotransferase class IV n=1 Tax=Aporhodopirellula aestuarii TaxID=2950107 RepID=A0ABT0TXV8_9BACT|nr:aminotransferase class IV [Aporhodopirellula aestuarii]MCM2369420.1 aminotransferase class IV [Aporhodopirellula aestuarii]
MNEQPPSAPDDFENHHAHFVCERIGQDGWLPYREIRLPVDDLGFRQAVTAVERLRTYDGQPFLPAEHWQRFRNTLALVGIANVPSVETLDRRMRELLDRNDALIAAQRDVGITAWATPGDRIGSKPTMAMHLNAIDHEAGEKRRSIGQPVVLTEVVQPDQASWPRQAKVRCRLHYFIADTHASDAAPGSTGLLRDSDGSWTESSVANIGLVIGGELVLAPAERILPGVTQAFVVKHAGSLGIATQRKPLTTSMILDAEAMLLMGTDTGLWFASEVSEIREGQATVIRRFKTPEIGSIVRRLQSGFPGIA